MAKWTPQIRRLVTMAIVSVLAFNFGFAYGVATGASSPIGHRVANLSTIALMACISVQCALRMMELRSAHANGNIPK
jgi:hypothetical protein